MRFNLIQFLRKRYSDWQIKKGVRILEGLDGLMIKAGYKRHERRQFWRDFIGRQSIRSKVYEKLND